MTIFDYRPEDRETHFVMLKREGMFLTGLNEQSVREQVPMFNSWDQEARIANAISAFLPPKPAAIKPGVV